MAIRLPYSSKRITFVVANAVILFSSLLFRPFVLNDRELAVDFGRRVAFDASMDKS
jgi:hypothetical protein